MATASNVLSFSRRSSVPLDTRTGDPSRVEPTFRTTHNVEPRDEAGRVSIEDLYPSTEAAAPELDVALRLLARGLEYVNEAFAATQTGNAIVGDDAMQRLQALLPELFNCRVLGDGYGAIINAVLGSLENMRGSPLNKQQIGTIRQVLRRVRSEPFIQYSSALDEIEKLEQANFVIEPSGFEHLADWLDE
jgi:hypothetical protein